MKLAASIIVCVWALNASANYGHLQPSYLGDARLARLSNAPAISTRDISYNVTLPDGQHHAFTVVGWMRVVTSNKTRLGLHAFWCPEPIIKSNPDLLAGAGAFGNTRGTNLTDLGGTIVVSNFPWQPYMNATLAPVTNKWPKGVYTVAGWASNAVTVTLGGTDYVLGPGAFNRNAEPGPASSVVISGTGFAAIGISRTPCNRYFAESSFELDGVKIVEGRLTNEISMCVWRFRVDGSNQISRLGLSRMGAFEDPSTIKTNAAPECGAFDSRGYYRIGVMGLGISTVDLDAFDFRVFPWYLTEKELERIHFNATEEIQRRGIPQWR